jgi:hypothetical protein
MYIFFITNNKVCYIIFMFYSFFIVIIVIEIN